jgi:hypothetical protein
MTHGNSKKKTKNKIKNMFYEKIIPGKIRSIPRKERPTLKAL